MSSNANGGNHERIVRRNLKGKVTLIAISSILVAIIAAFSGIRSELSPSAPNRETRRDEQSAAKPKRNSSQALQVLTELRQRYDSVPQQPENPNQEPSDSNFEAAAQPASLPPGMAIDFEANPIGFLTHFPESSGQSSARVTIPSRANVAFDLQDIGTGMQVQATLEGAQDTPAEMADGYAVYRQALGPDTALLRRAMPNGSEDFVSFAQPPREPSVSYQVTFDSNVAGLRNVGNALELLDASGSPRLRVSPPYIVSADGTWVEAKLTLSGCSSDANPTAPWGRPVTAPGGNSCHLRVSWDNDSVEYPALLDPTWITTNSMATARKAHTATLLSTGKVLVAGGTNGTSELASAELYDRTTGTWATTGSMTGARQMHTAVQLNTSSNPTTSGKVLVAGGRSGTTSLNTAQLYSPSAGTWVAAGNLNAARQQHTATLLPSGKVLVTGGVSGTSLLASAATYNPSSGSGTWTATTGPMPLALKFHAATLISTTNTQLNGKVLVTGGNNGTSSLSVVYLYDPAQLAFSTLANMPSAREGHTATALPSTKILLAGGRNGSSTLSSAVVFDPGFGPGSWSATGNLTAPRQGHSASLLSNGQVLVAGGSNGTSALSSAELYNGTTVWTATTAMPAAVQAHTATVLSNSIVLIAGGVNGSTVQSAARLYDVTGGNACTSNSQCLSGNCVSGVCCDTACTDQCMACNLAGLVGICSPRANGIACNDNNACTKTDTCQSGSCTGSNPVICSALDQCHDVGTCNTSTGVCSDPNKVDGASCSDGNACTLSDSCQTGACISGSPKVCAASDGCHLAGICEPTSGACSDPTAPDGTVCSDNDACTAGDQCATGACQPGASISVDDSDACTSDSCDPATGTQHVPVTDSAICSTWFSGGLQLQVRTDVCGANQTQQSFQITNKSATPISFSDISIKFWVNDTSGSSLEPQITSSGEALVASSYHAVTGVVAAATSLPSACGPDANHQANWEIAITNSDSTQLNPGETWSDLQAQLQLTGGVNFSPGTGSWYSPCLSSGVYATENHYAIYYQGNLVFASGINAPACSGPHGIQVLNHHITQELVAAPWVSPMPASTILQFALGLPVPSDKAAEFKQLIKDVADPNSPLFRHFLTATEFAATFSPTIADQNALIAWATANGLTVTHTFPNRLLVGVSGTVANIQRALYLNLNYYQRPDGTQFYAPDREPSLDLAPAVLHVSGLNNYAVPLAAGDLDAKAHTGGDYRKYYANCQAVNKPYGDAGSPLTGLGQCVGLMSWGNVFSPKNPADAQPLWDDIATYRATYMPSATGTVEAIVVDSSISDYWPPNPETVVEVESDIEMVMSMAPAANIYVYETSMSMTGLALNAMATDEHNCQQLSQSWLPVMLDENDTQVLQAITLGGKSYMVSSGDWGNTVPARDTGGLPVTSYTPANFAETYMTVVGGTVLDTTVTPPTEVAWHFGGGGVENAVKRPSYQDLLTENGVSTVSRNLPDLAMVAYDMGVVVTYHSDPHDKSTPIVHNLTLAIGGTSLSAPLFAGMVALANESIARRPGHADAKIGPLNETLYGIGATRGTSMSVYSQVFNDITKEGIYSMKVEGGKYVEDTLAHPAAPGYDLATGWGSPRCLLISQLASDTPTQLNMINPLQVTVGVTGTSSGGPNICINGTGFTPGGTVTVYYDGVPEESGGTKLVTSTQAVSATGTFGITDDEKVYVGQAVTDGIPACTEEFMASGVVSVNVIDDASGFNAGATMPARYWCAINQTTSYGAGCYTESAARVYYSQFGACVSFIHGSVGVGIGPNLAFVGFSISRIENLTPRTFAFDPKKIYVQDFSGAKDYAGTGTTLGKFYEYFLGPFAMDSNTFPPGSNANIGPSGDLAVIVNTASSNAANEANNTVYTLNYDGLPADPDVVFVNTDPGTTSWAVTPDCCDMPGGSAFCF